MVSNLAKPDQFTWQPCIDVLISDVEYISYIMIINIIFYIVIMIYPFYIMIYIAT